MSTYQRIVLASASERRKHLLDQIGVSYDVVIVDINETPHKNETPVDYVKRLAEEKAKAGFEKSTKQFPALGADTTVVIDGCILGKPNNTQHSIDMLMRLSGKTHQVMTGVSMIDQYHQKSFVNITDVTFSDISQEQALAYWQTGEPRDKAGSYAIQGYAAIWVKEIKGSFSSVVGLPLYETAQLLNTFGVMVWRD